MYLRGYIFEYPTGAPRKIAQNLTSEEYELMWNMLHVDCSPEVSGIQGYLILKKEDEKE